MENFNICAINDGVLSRKDLKPKIFSSGYLLTQCFCPMLSNDLMSLIAVDKNGSNVT